MREPFHRLLVGRTLAGRYEIEELIGAGGMSVVFRGRDRTLGRPVSVKVVALPAESGDMLQNLRERFRREAGSAAQIPHHPNVVQVYDYGTDPELDLDFIVMELLRGRDLKEALAVSPPSADEAHRILLEAARGLAAGHRAGIVHRDVKPANVFLAGEDRLESVRLLDFGIAKPAEPEPGDALTTIGQLPHSPAYASPEQLDPSAPVTFASDVYQLGLIGYEMLAGARPFTAEDQEKIRAGHDVPLPETPRWAAVSPALRRVVARALRTRPADRYADAAEFAEALSAAVRDEHTVLQAAPAPPPVVAEPTEFMPPPAAAPVPPPRPPIVEGGVPVRAPEPAAPRRRPRVSPLLALPALLLVVLLIWALGRRGGGDGKSAEAAPAVVPPDTAELASLEETFVQLQGSVSDSLAREAQRAAAARPDGAPPPTGEGGAPIAVPPVAENRPDAAESTDERQARETEAAEEVERAIRDLNESWVEGDLDRHIGHYADRLARYYNQRGATQDFVRRDRGLALQKYDDREMTVERIAITFPRPGRARALVDKTWRFEGDDERWDGAERQELILGRRGDRWLVVSERDNEVYRSRRTPL